MRIVLFTLSLLFVAASQALLSEPFFFQPDMGELGWPAGVVLTACAAPLLWWASRPSGGRLWRQALLAALVGASWLALWWMAYTAMTEPWTLYRIPQWLNPSTMEYRPSPGVWRPLHVLHITGPVFAVAALCATEQPQRWRWAALGAAPWLLGVALYAAMSAAEAPTYMG